MRSSSLFATVGFVAFALGLGTTGCGSASAAAGTTTTTSADVSRSFAWPKPEGWKKETIPFPLEFAPTLPYKGVEELRFAPKFFDPSADTYFSYSFAWLLDGAPNLNADKLGMDLAGYFKGLSRAVNVKRHDDKVHSAKVSKFDTGSPFFRGEVSTVDAFGDGRALTLHVEGEVASCDSRTVLLITLSPKPESDPVWATLRAQRATFACSK
jgi:hypothetical protein